MLRRLFYQDATSNKFWTVEVLGLAQVVTFGRVGTAGRQTTRQFASVAACQAATQKLVAQKLAKGYQELPPQEFIPEKTLTDEEARQFFWHSIEQANKKRTAHWSEYDVEEHLENLKMLLARSSKLQLVQFERYLQLCLHQLYTAEIAELSIILESPFERHGDAVVYDGYLSDDGFIYFRCWLLLKGQQFFEDITQDINAFVSGAYSFNIGDTWAEGLLYVTDEAYGLRHENPDESAMRDAVAEQFPEVMHYDSMQRTMNRKPLGGADLQARYPQLVAEIADLRSEG
ncbi:MAG: DUF4240 domain-containing protein [Janthinobacterium lividum]